MIPAAVLLACPNLAVPARLMYHVAQVESDANPYAIGVVGGHLLRQPASLEEAIATARSLEAQGYNFSVGVAQVNHANLKKYGLDTYEKAFSICDNLLAGSRILAQCYADASGVWGKAFSCYYSGDFTTGYRDGYVQRVLTSLSQGGAVEQSSAVAGVVAPVPVLPSADAAARVRVRTAAPDSAAWRVAMRSSVLDAAANALAIGATQKLSRADPKEALQEATLTASTVASVQAAADARRGPPASAASSPIAISSGPATAALAPAAEPGKPEVFVPQVSDLKTPAPQKAASDGHVSSTLAASVPPPENPADAAFVF